jgi:hypothetical protein
MLAAPLTSEMNTSGTTSIIIPRRNTCPRNRNIPSTRTVSFKVPDGIEYTKIPTIIPITNAIRTFVVSPYLPFFILFLLPIYYIYYKPYALECQSTKPGQSLTSALA